MVDIREKRVGSFLDPASWAKLGYVYGQRIWKVCKGRPGVFVTLTYNRDGYAGPLDLYRRQSEKKHIKCFIQKLQRRLGYSLKGRWVRKMEFQRGGWVHWHLIILGEKFIPQEMLESCWPHGFVSLRALTKKRVFYTCKYVGKGGIGVPAWLYGEPPRSVRIIQSSPGFWPEEDRKPSTYCPIYAKYGPPPPQRIPGFRPIGAGLREGRGCTVRDQRQHKCFSIKCEPAVLLAELGRRAKCLGNVKGGWLRYDCDVAMVEDAAAAIGWASAAAAARRRPPEGGGGAPRSGAFNLRGTGQRHGAGEDGGQNAAERMWRVYLNWAWWVETDYRESAMEACRQETWPDDAKDSQGNRYKSYQLN
jgi:hypothetical protein